MKINTWQLQDAKSKFSRVGWAGFSAHLLSMRIVKMMKEFVIDANI